MPWANPGLGYSIPLGWSGWGLGKGAGRLGDGGWGTVFRILANAPAWGCGATGVVRWDWMGWGSGKGAGRLGAGGWVGFPHSHECAYVVDEGT